MAVNKIRVREVAKRVGNFSIQEKKFLSELVRRYDIVESKGYSAGVLEKKKAAWKKITDVFNSKFSENQLRNSRMLIGLWRRIKLQAKGSLDKKDTGGGPSGSPIGVPEGSDITDPLGNPANEEGKFSEVLISEGETMAVDPLPLCMSPSGTSTSSQTSQLGSKKRKYEEVDEEEEMKRELYLKQLHILQLKEKKAMLDLYLVEKEIEKKGYELPTWHIKEH